MSAQRTYEISHGWGDRLEWMNYETGQVSGHKTPRPVAGDLMKAPMQSDRVGVFRFVRVDYCLEPGDMFFGIVEPVGYEDEIGPAS